MAAPCGGWNDRLAIGFAFATIMMSSTSLVLANTTGSVKFGERKGRKIVDVEVADDHLFLSGFPPEMVGAALACRTVKEVGRKGKFWWLNTGEPPVVEREPSEAALVESPARDRASVRSAT